MEFDGKFYPTDTNYVLENWQRKLWEKNVKLWSNVRMEEKGNSWQQMVERKRNRTFERECSKFRSY